MFRNCRPSRPARSRRLRFEFLDRREMLTTFVVDDDGPACRDPTGHVGHNYCDLQAAVDAAAEGDRIHVRGGSYHSASVETDNLTLRRIGNAPAVIETRIYVQADGVSVEGFEVHGRGNTVVGMFGDNNTLRNNVASGHNITAYAVVGSNAIVENNVALAGSGVCCDRSTGFNLVVTSSTVSGNTAEGQTNAGFSISGDENLITANQASNNVLGFMFSTLSDSVVANNVADSNFGLSFVGGGFRMRLGSGNLLINNAGTNNTTSGFLIDATDTTLIGNLAAENVFNGFVLNADDVTLINNIAVGNGYDGFGGTMAGGYLGENLSLQNGRHGFSFSATSSGLDTLVVVSNIADGNGADGFRVSGVFATALFADNSAEENAEYGYFVDAFGVTFLDNECDGNRSGGSNLPGIC